VLLLGGGLVIVGIIGLLLAGLPRRCRDEGRLLRAVEVVRATAAECGCGALRRARSCPRMHGRMILGALVAPIALLAHPRLRRAVQTYGASEEEAAARLPGDELLEDADTFSTRAIDIDAPAAAVWPWLAQMGPAPRGGAYTYDWIESPPRS
jgi:hypothetical protein